MRFRPTHVLTVAIATILVVGCSTTDIDPSFVAYSQLDAASDPASGPITLQQLDRSTVSGVVTVSVRNDWCRALKFRLTPDPVTVEATTTVSSSPWQLLLDGAAMSEGEYVLTVRGIACSPRMSLNAQARFLVDHSGSEKADPEEPGGEPNPEPEPQPDPTPDPEPEPSPSPEPEPAPAEPSPAIQGDLYVSLSGSDSSDGTTPERALRTIARASALAQPGFVVVVAPGTYKGTVTTTASGTSTSPITYLSAEPHGAVIDATGHYTAWVNTGNNVAIVGFAVRNSDYIGIYNRASNVTVQGNDVGPLFVPTCNSPNGGAGILHGDYTKAQNRTISNVVHGIRAKDGDCNHVHGIYQGNADGVIQNNIVFDVSAKGIQNWHASNRITIANNLIWDVQTGILVGSDTQAADGFVVSNNVIMYSKVGIQEFGREFYDNQYLNNLLYANSTDFVMEGGSPKATIRTDPRLEDFRRDGSGDYRPSLVSPLVDAGTFVGAPLVDYEGIERPQSSTVDVGPFEARPTTAIVADPTQR